MSARYDQLPLDLSFRPAMGREDFLIAACNDKAVAWIDQYPAWPSPVTVLQGPGGSGKSHLMAVWALAANAVQLDGPSLRVANLAEQIGDATAVAVDRADAVLESDCLFHLVNMMRERAGHLLIATLDPPARWQFGTADMRSRLAAAPLLVLGPPDDDILSAIMVKQFFDRQLTLAPDVIRFVLGRMPRTFQAASDIVNCLDRLSLAGKQRVTVPLAREAMRRLGYFEDSEE